MTDTFLTVNPGDEVTAEDHNDLAEGLSGVAGAGRLVKITEVSDTTTPALAVGNKATGTTVPISLFTYGSSATTALSLTPARAYFNVPVWDKGGRVFDVRAFGAVADWNGVTLTGTDNTTAFNAALQAAQDAGGGIVFFEGSYRVTGTLNLTGTQKIQLQGGGIEHSAIVFYPSSNSTADEQKPVLSIVASYGLTLSDFTVDCPGSARRAGAGIFISSDTTPGAPSTRNYFTRVGVSGYYTAASVMAYGHGDCIFTACNVVVQQTNTYGVALTTQNNINTSALGTAMTAGVATTLNGTSLTLLTGIQNVSNHQFYACELHNDVVGAKATVYLHGAGSTRFIGGVISNVGASYFQLSSNGTYATNQVSVIATQCENEGGTVAARMFDITDSTEIDGLVVTNANGTATYGIGSSNNAQFRVKNLFWQCAQSVSGTIMTHVAFYNSSGTTAADSLSDSFINCNGKDIKVAGNLPTSLTLLNPGTVAANGGTYNHLNLRIGSGGNDVASGTHTHTSLSGFVRHAESGTVRVLRGRLFTSSGTGVRVDSGTGFTATRNGVGDVTLTFASTFAAQPTVVANVEAATGSYARAVNVVALGTSQARLQAAFLTTAEENEIDFVIVGA